MTRRSGNRQDAPARGGLARPCLTLGDRQVVLTDGAWLLGRDRDCAFMFSDPRVSRRHARLVVAAGEVTVEDIDSVNGVFVNGERVIGARRLRVGDRIVIGSQELEIGDLGADLASHPRVSSDPPSEGRPTLVAVDEPSTNRSDMLALLCSVADKSLALGRPVDAERVLGPQLQSILDSAKGPVPLESDTYELAASYALKFAAGGARDAGKWVDYVVELYAALGSVPSAALMEELFISALRVPEVNLKALQSYVSTLREAAARFGPAERFLVGRLEGLERTLRAR
jgi:predicted component of type VI protein secretion system